MAHNGGTARNSQQEVSYKGDSNRPKFNMVCKKCGSVYDDLTVNNWNIEWCRIRIEFGSKCTFDCHVAKHLIETEGIKEWRSE